MIDFARRPGLELFAMGELLPAQTLWRAALELDPDNELPGRCLEEVEARLRSLESIKSTDPDEPR